MGDTGLADARAPARHDHGVGAGSQPVSARGRRHRGHGGGRGRSRSLVLFIPFLDVALAIVRRTRRGVERRARRQGAPPPPPDGHRARPPQRRPADVPVERPRLGGRPRGGADRRARPWSRACSSGSSCLFAITVFPRLARVTRRASELGAPTRNPRTRGRSPAYTWGGRQARPLRLVRVPGGVFGRRPGCGKIRHREGGALLGRGWTWPRSTFGWNGSPSCSGTSRRWTTCPSTSTRASSSACSGRRDAGRRPPCA